MSVSKLFNLPDKISGTSHRDANGAVRSSMFAGAEAYLNNRTAPLTGAVLRDPREAHNGTPRPQLGAFIVIACKAGHEMSQMVAADLRAKGYDARVLEGGYAAWSEAGLPLVDKAG